MSRPKKTATRKKTKSTSPSDNIGKRNPDGSVNMVRVDDYGEVTVVPVHIIKGRNIAYGPAYDNKRDMRQYPLDGLFLSKEEALEKSKCTYKAYETDVYDGKVTKVFLKLYRGKVVRVDPRPSWMRDRLGDLYVTQVEALNICIARAVDEVVEAQKTLQKQQAKLKRLRSELSKARKVKKDPHAVKFSNVTDWVLDAEQTRKEAVRVAARDKKEASKQASP